MEIIKIDNSVAHIALMPDDCLVLSAACEWAADAWGADGADTNPRANPVTEYTFRALACAFHGLAFATDATGRFRASEAQDFDHNGIARAWNVVPGILGGAR